MQQTRKPVFYNGLRVFQLKHGEQPPEAIRKSHQGAKDEEEEDDVHRAKTSRKPESLWSRGR